jgi:hypothetical protein
MGQVAGGWAPSGNCVPQVTQMKWGMGRSCTGRTIGPKKYPLSGLLRKPSLSPASGARKGAKHAAAFPRPLQGERWPSKAGTERGSVAVVHSENNSACVPARVEITCPALRNWRLPAAAHDRDAQAWILGSRLRCAPACPRMTRREAFMPIGSVSDFSVTPALSSSYGEAGPTGLAFGKPEDRLRPSRRP